MQEQIKKIIINIAIGLVFIFLILAGMLYIINTELKDKSTETESDIKEQGLMFSKIPGMILISEESTGCSFQADYIYSQIKDVDMTEGLKDILKENYSELGWKVGDEKTESGWEIIEFAPGEIIQNEIVQIKTTFESGKGSYFTFIYKWDDCI